MFLETFWRHGFAKEYYISLDEIETLVTEAMQFISGFEFTLTQGLPQEKLVALRQCIEKIWVNRPAGEIKLAICPVPAGNLQDTAEIKTSVSSASNTSLHKKVCLKPPKLNISG